ncbi:DUF423 domain-containing protein [Gammaproteobacteria bacterium]|nr:DUF423 domain-containing protein [Gammaproteobacteria bacterium]
MLGASAVVFGAFGAHALDTYLDEEALSNWATAVDYQLIHALLLFALTQGRTTLRKDLFTLLSCWSILVGTVMFSGSIYGMVLGGFSWLWPVTPLGGMFLILGWCLITYQALRSKV